VSSSRKSKSLSVKDACAAYRRRKEKDLLIQPNSSIPQKRPTPKEGATAKPAPTAEELAEWKEGLKDCMQEVAKLEASVGVKY